MAGCCVVVERCKQGIVLSGVASLLSYFVCLRSFTPPTRLQSRPPVSRQKQLSSL